MGEFSPSDEKQNAAENMQMESEGGQDQDSDVEKTIESDPASRASAETLAQQLNEKFGDLPEGTQIEADDILEQYESIRGTGQPQGGNRASKVFGEELSRPDVHQAIVEAGATLRLRELLDGWNSGDDEVVNEAYQLGNAIGKSPNDITELMRELNREQL